MEKLTYVYLIRHSETIEIEASKQEENEKIILSEQGKEKAKDISKLKELQNIDILWSSNYTRAVQTAEYIAKQNNIKINIDKNLGERKLR